MIRTILAGACAAAALTASAFAQDGAEAEPLTVIHAGTLIAAPGEERPRREVSILVRGERIEAIEDGFVTPDGAAIVDLSDDFVMPGFIDAHVHITGQQGPGRRIANFTEGPADNAIDGVLYAGRTVRAGFTTIQDVGGNMEAVRALRDGVRAGDFIGPRMRIAGGAVTPTGGHGDSNGWSVQILRETGSPYACNGADDCARAVRQLVQEGADVIKIEAREGDEVRRQGTIVDGLSWYFASFNRNKRSVTLDLRAEAGKAVLHRLLDEADVLVENFRPGVLDKLGLGAAERPDFEREVQPLLDRYCFECHGIEPERSSRSA